MLFFIIAWLGLILICFVIGTDILNLFQANCFRKIGDRFIVAAWLGVVILAILLLAVSLILPLSPLVGATATIMVTILALRSPRTRKEVLTFFSSLSLKVIWGFFALEICVAAYTARVVTWYDTGLYHFQVIRWLSRFGVVPGLALIHHRFGFTSSWFALATPFNAGILEARSSAVTGGFVLLLALLQFQISFRRILKHQELFPDWFVFFWLLLCLPISVISHHGGIPISPSPDLPVILLAGIVSWTFIMIANKPVKPEKNSTLESRVIPLILSAGAVTIKVSAIPILFVSVLFYLLGSKLKFQRILVSAAITTILLLPMLAFGTITSGCPVFPSSLFCLDLPWSVGGERAQQVTEIIKNWARWFGPTPDYGNSWNWFGHWLKLAKGSSILMICSIVSALLLVRKSQKSQFNAQKYVIALALLGMAYMMYGAPSLRFGLGYLCLLPALLMATYSPLSKSKSNISNVLVIIASFLVIALVFYNFIFHHNNDNIYVLLPPKLQKPTEFLDKTSNDLSYSVPNDINLNHGYIDDRCWAAELPCTPEHPNNIKLRNPQKGIRAGFIKVLQ